MISRFQDFGWVGSRRGDVKMGNGLNAIGPRCLDNPSYKTGLDVLIEKASSREGNGRGVYVEGSGAGHAEPHSDGFYFMMPEREDRYESFVGLDTDIFYAGSVVIWENDSKKGSRKTIVDPLTGEILAPEEKNDLQMRFEEIKID